ncbi:MarR family winged helix-turn-helix transcriptional regulator [Amycolatopsis sp. NPDC004747]
MSEDFYDTWLEMLGRMSRPKLFGLIMERAGVTLDRALFPLLVRIDVLEPVGVVDLADLLGLNHSTISRELAKLESLGLIKRHQDGADRRVRQASTTPKGRTMVQAINKARQSLTRELLADWTLDERKAFTVLLRRLADSMDELSTAKQPARQPSTSDNGTEPPG